MRPSALAAPGGCTTLILPSGPRFTSRPMRSKICGSLAYCGSSSFWMIDCGTYQDGLTMMWSIDALDLLARRRAVDGGERFGIDQAGRLDVDARLHLLDGVEQCLVVAELARL